MSADKELGKFISTNDLPKTSNNKINVEDNRIIYLKKNNEFYERYAYNIEFTLPYSTQLISIGASTIPFVRHNDANRALMGSSMQRQSLPLKYKESAIVETGIENLIVKNSQSSILASESGFVKFVSSKKVIIATYKKSLKKKFNDISSNQKKKLIEKFEKIKKKVYSLKIKHTHYHIEDARKSNTYSSLYQKIIVKKNDWVKKGEIIADGAASLEGSVRINYKY